MTTLLPTDLTAVSVRILDQLRAAIGGEKLAVRRQAYAESPGLLRRFTPTTIALLRPLNAAIDRINHEEARRDEEAFQKRQLIRTSRAARAV